MTKSFLLRSERPWLLHKTPPLAELSLSSSPVTVSVVDGDGNPVRLARVRCWWYNLWIGWEKVYEESTPSSGVVVIPASKITYWGDYRVNATDGVGVEEYKSLYEIFHVDWTGPSPDAITLVVGPPSQQPHDLIVKVVDASDAPVKDVKIRAWIPTAIPLYDKTKRTDELGQVYWDIADDKMLSGEYKCWGYRKDLQTEEREFTVEPPPDRRITPSAMTLHLVYEREIPWWEALGKYVPWILAAATALGVIYVLKPPVVVVSPRK